MQLSYFELIRGTGQTGDQTDGRQATLTVRAA